MIDNLIAAVIVQPAVPLPTPTVIAAGVVAGEREPRPDRATSTRRQQIAHAATLPAAWRPFARCVVARESGGNPKARNPHSSAQGKFQFLDRSWRHGLAHMVAQRLHANGMGWAEARAVRDWLRARSIAAWPEPFQDIGFAAVVAAGGWRHWGLAGSACNGMAGG